MSEKTQRTLAASIGLGLLTVGAILFVVFLLKSEPPEAGLLIAGALVVVALAILFWAVAENPSEPEPIDLTHARDHEPEVRTRGYVTTPGTRFAYAILSAIGGGLVMVFGAFVAGGAAGEPSAAAGAVVGGVLFFVGAIVIVSSQYHLIAAGVARGILDTRE